VVQSLYCVRHPGLRIRQHGACTVPRNPLPTARLSFCFSTCLFIILFHISDFYTCGAGSNLDKDTEYQYVNFFCEFRPPLHEARLVP
jgi:hypothetical protein